MQLIWVYFQPFQRNLLLKCVLQPENSEKITKPPILEVQGYLRSFMLTALRSSSPVFVIIRIMSMPICNHFHARPANSEKITFFRGCPSFPPRSRGSPSPNRIKFCHEILETLSCHMVKTRTLYLT